MAKQHQQWFIHTHDLSRAVSIYLDKQHVHPANKANNLPAHEIGNYIWPCSAVYIVLILGHHYFQCVCVCGRGGILRRGEGKHGPYGSRGEVNKIRQHLIKVDENQLVIISQKNNILQ